MHFRIPILIVAPILAITGCNPAGPTSAPGTPSKVQTAGEEIQEALQASGEALREQREKFTKSAEEQLKELDRKAADLGTRIAQASGETKAALEKQLERVKVSRKDVELWLEKSRKATADTWDTVKDGFNNAMNKLKDELK